MISLFILFIVVVMVILLTSKLKLHPFFSLLIAALAIGFLEGMNGAQIIDSISTGFGGTLKSIGIIIAFGTVIGQYLEQSGGAKVLADNILNAVGKKQSDLAMSLTGFVVSIPVFCDSGFVVLSSLIRPLSKKSGKNMAVLSIALATGLYVTHVFVPPTPGPLAAAAAINADLGLVIILGLIIAIPVAFAGLYWARFIQKKLNFTIAYEEEAAIETKQKKTPSFINSLMPILVPIILIGLQSIAEYSTKPFGTNFIYELLVFLGDPIVALLIGVILVFRLKKYGDSSSNQKDWVVEGLKNAGIIILITGAGGAFGNVLRDSNIGETIGKIFSGYQIGLFLPFIIAAMLKTAQGSSTVSIITTAAIISPLLGTLGIESEVSKALTVLAIGSGAMTVSHINDSYFWVVSQFSGLSTTQALKGFTTATFIQGITGIVIILLLSFMGLK